MVKKSHRLTDILDTYDTCGTATLSSHASAADHWGKGVPRACAAVPRSIATQAGTGLATACVAMLDTQDTCSAVALSSNCQRGRFH